MVIKTEFFILGQYQELSWCLLGEGICLLALLDEEKANINTRKSQSTPLCCFGFAKSHCAACGSGLLQLRPHLLPLRLSPRGCPWGCSLNWQSVNTHIDMSLLRVLPGSGAAKGMAHAEGLHSSCAFVCADSKWQR